MKFTTTTLAVLLATAISIPAYAQSLSTDVGASTGAGSANVGASVDSGTSTGGTIGTNSTASGSNVDSSFSGRSDTAFDNRVTARVEEDLNNTATSSSSYNGTVGGNARVENNFRAGTDKSIETR